MMTLKILAALALAPVMALAAGVALAQTPSDEGFDGIEIYLEGSDTPADPDDELTLNDREAAGVPVEPEENRGGVAPWMADVAWALYFTAVFGVMFGVGALIGRRMVGIALRRRRRN